MLGGLRVLQSDRTITRFQTQKTGALLAYLALNLNGSHSREVLAELLWPGADPIAVRNRLNQAVSSLRRQLEPPGIIHGTVLITDQRTIRLNPDAIETDIHEFAARIQAADHTQNGMEKLTNLRRAIDLYSGEFLSGVYADWVTMEQVRFADMYSSALFELLDASRESGDVDQAIRAATLLLKEDPTDEGTHCDLMQVYLDAGRPAAAKRQFEELVRILAAEGETPSEEAIALNKEASIRRPVTPKPVAAVSPESAPASAAAPVSTIPNLPAAMNRFVGRESDIAKLQQLLTTDSVRLVTILGVGGSGKTRLAIQTALTLQQSFGRNTYFVPLADLHDANQIVGAIAGSIGIREAENVPSRLRQNERTLLILDNIEHLVDSGAAIVQSLLREVPTLSCLTTSRCAMRIEGERCYALSPLPAPPDTDAVADLIDNPSIALFVDRAQAALPDFQLTQRNADIVRQLCDRLEGLPLAIELAASWAKTIAPYQMLSMLADRFSLLESRRRDISSRHRTMRAVIDSSFTLLKPDLKTLFLRLSVFSGGWTLPAAAEVCQRPNVLHAMEELHEQSLILIADSVGESMRFRMLDTLRDYAIEHLPTADAAETANLHADFYIALSGEGLAHMEGPDQIQWTDRLDSEYLNIAAAFHWFLSHDLYESAIAMASNMAAYWEVKGRIREGCNWIERSLAQVDESAPLDRRLRATALTNLARLKWVRGDFESASLLHEQCLAEWNSLGDSEGIVYAQINIQLEAHRTRNYEKSVSLLEDNLRRSTELGDQTLASRCWLGLGNTSVEQHKFDHALSCYEESLQSARSVGNVRRAAHALNNLGNLALLRGQTELARDHLTQALTLFESTGAKSQVTGANLLLARIERLGGHEESARKWLAQAQAQNSEETYHTQRMFLEHAHLASHRKEYGLAALLLGFVQHARESSGGLNFDVEQAEVDSLIDDIKEGISSSAYVEAVNLGRSLDQAEVTKRIYRKP